MNRARYRFVRKNKSIKGFLSSNSPSTDALNAVDNWSNAKPQRSYTTLVDENEQLLVELSWSESDDSAGPDLEESCHKFGVNRFHEES